MTKIKKSTVDGEFIMFKGKPLVRQGHMLCYGSLQDEYVLTIMAMNNKELEFGEIKNSVPAMVLVQVMKKNEKTGQWESVKQFTKNGLYEALDIGCSYIQGLGR